MIQLLFRALFAAPIILSATGPTQADTLTVAVEGLRSQKGQVLVALHDRSSSFPSKWSEARRVVRLPAGQATRRAVFKNLPKGQYAVVVVHDEDRDGKMTKNLIGFPREGFGSSNNPSAFGPPRFRPARFDLDGDRALRIRVTYL